MGEKTGISWCDHTFNPWIGCTKISQGCKFCYAERENNRYRWVDGWSKGIERCRTSEANWQKPMQWAYAAGGSRVHRRVFCASLADVFDDEVPEKWRQDLWDVIEKTLEFSVLGEPADDCGLEWLILTKRPENIGKMLPAWMQGKPSTWLRIGVSVEDQINIIRIDQLLQVWHGNNFLSIEPMLESVDLEHFLQYPPCHENYKMIFGLDEWSGIDWVICGCESGPHARPMELDWARSIRDQCQMANVPFFLKQMEIDGKLVKQPFLDGRQWLEFPEER